MNMNVIKMKQHDSLKDIVTAEWFKAYCMDPQVKEIKITILGKGLTWAFRTITITGEPDGISYHIGEKIPPEEVFGFSVN